MKITIVYDNNAHDQRLQTAWGFACVVELRDSTILFDTGGNGSILLSNMGRLSIEPKQVDMVVLSHVHGDHVGGLAALLTKHHDVTIVIPASFPSQFKEEIRSSGARLREISRPGQLAAHVYTTGVLDGGIEEQSLVVNSEAGLIIITGCAHPGVTRIVEEAKRHLDRKVALVMGGFHLGGKSRRELSEIVRRFEQLGVTHAAPCHCSGDEARAAFKQAYGDSYLPAGVGFTVDLQDLGATHAETG